MLLKSCATPPASCPTASRRCDCLMCASRVDSRSAIRSNPRPRSRNSPAPPTWPARASSSPCPKRVTAVRSRTIGRRISYSAPTSAALKTTTLQPRRMISAAVRRPSASWMPDAFGRPAAANMVRSGSTGTAAYRRWRPSAPVVSRTSAVSSPIGSATCSLRFTATMGYRAANAPVRSRMAITPPSGS
jgi:hypothetical protein